MTRLIDRLSAALESADGTPVNEIEYTFYGKIPSLDALKEAVTVEKQQQANIPLAKKGVRLRVRKVGDDVYLATLKTPDAKDKMVNKEIEFEISMSAFNEFLKVGENACNKTRYTIPVPGTSLKYEVDVFFRADGTPSEWVKIDLEVPASSVEAPEFPFEVLEYFAAGPGMTQEERDFVDGLWNKEWSVRSGNE